MNLWEFIGYDKQGSIKEVNTTLNRGKLGTKDVTLAALGFNAPAWVAASSMSILYAIAGHAAPLSILIAYFFPMLVLALCMVYLTRQAPSAGGIFTFSERFLHPYAGTILGWSYTVACVAVAPMTAVIGAEYIQALFPYLQGETNAKIIGTVMLIIFLLVSFRGIEITARVAGIFLVFEIVVVAGLGLMGIVDPRVDHLSFASLYLPVETGGWSTVGPGVLFGVWMLANFDSSINYIEEARLPVRTIQRSLMLVLTSAFVIYSLAAIGWQYAVPVEKLATIIENGDGGPIAAVANVYLPPSLSWIAIFVVITSSAAGMQISMSSGSRSAYRMSSEGHLPKVFSKVNQYKAPWVTSTVLTAVGIVLVWYKPLSKLQWYYDVVTMTLVFSYISAVLSFIRLLFLRHTFAKALLCSVLPFFAIAVLGYIAYTAGALPVNPEDLYHAWYIGAGVVLTGVLWVFWGKSKKVLPANGVNS